MARNNRSVRGPRSALTSFLEERGIRNTNPGPGPLQSRRNRNGNVETIQEESQTGNNEENQENETEEAIEEETVEITISAETRVMEALTGGSNIVEEDSAIDVEEGPIQGSSTDRRSRRNLKKKKNADSDDEFKSFYYNDDLGDKAKYTTRSSKNKDNDEPIDSVTFCSNCQKRFVVTSNCLRRGNVIYCEACSKDPDNMDKKKTDKMTVKQTRKRRRNNALKGGLNFFDKDELPTLMSMCIQIISDNIDDVESFGDISSRSLLQISRILSKHRRLDDLTLPLFLSSNSNVMHLYDTARLNEDSLLKIAESSPDLEDLKLQFCGRMNNEILINYSKSFPNLTSVSLHGLFLVTEVGFKAFFEGLGAQLKNVAIQFSPRFSYQSMKALVKNCTKLETLSLNSCSKLDDEAISLLVNKDSNDENEALKPSLVNLIKLDLSNSGDDCTDESLIQVLPIIGKKLLSLNLAGWKALTDDGIICGIKENCSSLIDLDLSLAENLTSDGLVNLLSDLSKDESLGLGLESINLSGCSILLSDDVIDCLFKYHHSSIKRVYLNGLDGLTSEGLEKAFKAYPPIKIETLDVSWVRAISDPLLTKVLPTLKSLSNITVWGCHRVTESLIVPSSLEDKIKVRIIGRECDTL